MAFQVYQDFQDLVVKMVLAVIQGLVELADIQDGVEYQDFQVNQDSAASRDLADFQESQGSQEFQASQVTAESPDFQAPQEFQGFQDFQEFQVIAVTRAHRASRVRHRRQSMSQPRRRLQPTRRS